MSLKHALYRNVKRFGNAERENENNVYKACILVVSETI